MPPLFVHRPFRIDADDFELEKLHVMLKSFYLERFARKGIKKLG